MISKIVECCFVCKINVHMNVFLYTWAYRIMHIPPWNLGIHIWFFFSFVVIHVSAYPKYLCIYILKWFIVSHTEWDTSYVFIYFRRVHGKSFSSLTRMCVFELNMISSIFLTKTILKTRKEEIVSTWNLCECVVESRIK